LRKGLAKSKKKLPIPETDIRFPYYGQTLYDLVSDVPAEEAAQVIVKGAEDETRRIFTEAVLNEIRRKLGITDAEVLEIAGGNVVQKGIQNKKLVLVILRANDSYLSGVSVSRLPDA